MIADPTLIHLFTTPWFWSSFIGWTLAQMIKMTAGLVKTGQVDFRYLLSTGGMPSAHSAMVCGLCTSIGLTEGFDAPITMLAAGFAAITMFDAAGVRRAAGHQAKILNLMIEELFTQHKLRHIHLKELIGHTRKEVFAGMLVGIAVAVATVYYWPHEPRTFRCPASPSQDHAATTASARL
ncbi:MAG: divergent PAP2 family protein [bacterium]